MTDRCELKHALGVAVACDEEECVYWRAAGHLDLAPQATGCAIQHFGMLGEGGAEVAGWLLSVKERVEAEGQDANQGAEHDIAESA